VSSQAEKEAIRGIISGWNNPVIVELGAHLGEEAEWIMPLVNNPSYLMVEPDAENCKKIRRRFPKIALVEAAIASSSGFVEFYPAYNKESDNRASGSIRRPVGHIKHFPQVSFDKPVQIKAWSLDHLFPILDHIDLLWCDIQGAERDMILGGRAALAKTHYMMIEAEPEVELYEGQALKPELLAMLPGWKVLQDFGYNLLMWNKEYK
jgi:FkbM family methyltransferase